MKVTPYGVRGSLAAGPTTARYGGNTSCVRVTGPDGTVLVLEGVYQAVDAGAPITIFELLVGAVWAGEFLPRLHRRYGASTSLH